MVRTLRVIVGRDTAGKLSGGVRSWYACEAVIAGTVFPPIGKRFGGNENVVCWDREDRRARTRNRNSGVFAGVTFVAKKICAQGMLGCVLDRRREVVNISHSDNGRHLKRTVWLSEDDRDLVEGGDTCRLPKIDTLGHGVSLMSIERVR